MLIFGYWVKQYWQVAAWRHLPEKNTENSGKLAIRPDHPRCRIKVKLCVVSGLRCVVKIKIL